MKLRVLIPSFAFRAVARYFFLAVAVACLGVYSYAYVQRVVYQTYESWKFDRMPHPVTVAAAVLNSSGVPAVSRGPSYRKYDLPSRRPPKTALIGRLSIPRLHLSAMVREGIDEDTLQLAVGHIPDTALPGETGNVAVAGHRDTFFRRLRELRPKDEIRFSTSSGDFKYQVESLVILEPDNLGVLAASSENVLTMVTCYPFSYVGAAPQRFIVRAKQVLPQTLARPTVE